MSNHKALNVIRCITKSDKDTPHQRLQEGCEGQENPLRYCEI